MIFMYPSSSIVAKSLQEKHNHDNVLEILPTPATCNNNNIYVKGLNPGVISKVGWVVVVLNATVVVDSD